MALEPKLVKKIIFDLDDTLFDTNGQLVQSATREACEAMIKAGLKANLEECLEFRQNLLAKKGRCEVYHSLVDHFGVSSGDPNQVAFTGSKQFHNREIKENITLFPETLYVLEQLKEKYELFLVTMGGLDTQKKKVELLDLEREFRKIFYVDIEKKKSKIDAFKQILGLYPNLEAFSFLSVGNRIDSELRDGKTLGMQTLLLAHGEYLNLKPQSDLEKPDETIQSLGQILEVMR